MGFVVKYTLDWILSEFDVRCLSVRILSVAILSGVRILTEFFKKVCPVSICPAGQEQDNGVRILMSISLTFSATRLMYSPL